MKYTIQITKETVELLKKGFEILRDNEGQVRINVTWEEYVLICSANEQIELNLTELIDDK